MWTLLLTAEKSKLGQSGHKIMLYRGQSPIKFAKVFAKNVIHSPKFRQFGLFFFKHVA